MLLAAATRVLGCTVTALPGTKATPWLRIDSAIALQRSCAYFGGDMRERYVAHGKRAARERRRRRSKVSRRRRAGHAPPARRGRRVRVPRAFKRPAKTFVVVVVVGGGGAHTNSELPQAGFP